MNFSLGILVVLGLAYVGRIIGAVLHDEDRVGGDPTRKPRTKVREVVDALAWPLTMFTSKAKRGMDLSALRVMAISAEYFILLKMDWASEWNMWKVIAILGPPGLLILEPLFALIPIKELSLAAAAYFGSQVAKRVSKKTEETTVEVPTVTVPVVVPPDNPAEEPTDGSGTRE